MKRRDVLGALGVAGALSGATPRRRAVAVCCRIAAAQCK